MGGLDVAGMIRSFYSSLTLKLSNLASPGDGADGSKWDRSINRLSRLPRPIMMFMIIGMFVWSVEWSGGDFKKWADGMSAVPDWLSNLIVLFVILVWGVKKIKSDLGNKQ